MAVVLLQGHVLAKFAFIPDFVDLIFIGSVHFFVVVFIFLSQAAVYRLTNMLH